MAETPVEIVARVIAVVTDSRTGIPTIGRATLRKARAVVAALYAAGYLKVTLDNG